MFAIRASFHPVFKYVDGEPLVLSVLYVTFAWPIGCLSPPPCGGVGSRPTDRLPSRNSALARAPACILVRLFFPRGGAQYANVAESFDTGRGWKRCGQSRNPGNDDRKNPWGFETGSSVFLC